MLPGGAGLLLLPPPHEQSATKVKTRDIRIEFFFRARFGRIKNPKIAVIKNDAAREERVAAARRDVVLTVAVKFVGVLEVTATLAGMEQVAPVGAPVQVSDTFPFIPLPPTARE